MRILFLTDNFPPEGNAPATRTYEHAVEWVRNGHEVTVITCAPNFPEGRLFPGYRNRVRSVEEMDGIRVVRVKTYITSNEGFLKRTLDYISFMCAGGLAALFERRPDVVVATSPQFFCAVGGWAVSFLRRLPFVFELRDMWPASITAVGAMRPNLAIRLLTRVEMFLYRQADVIVPVTESFAADLDRRGVDPGKIHVVLNGVDLAKYRPIPRDAGLAKLFDIEGRFVVGYLGTHGMAHGLDRVLDAASLLQDDERIVFLFAGAGAERARLERRVHEEGLGNVRMVPRQPKSGMPGLWSLCDVSLIPLRNSPVFADVIPSKLFEAMGMGIPVVMSLPPGEATRIVERTDCGLCVTPEDPAALASELRRLVQQPEALARMSRAGTIAAPSYSRKHQAARMLDVLLRAAGDSVPVKAT